MGTKYRDEAAVTVEYQFIPSFNGKSSVHDNYQLENPESKSLSALRNGSDKDIYVSLQLGEPEPKRRKYSDSLCIVKESK